MDDLLTPVKTVRNVRSNIEKFETLSLRDTQGKNDVSSTRKVISEVANGTEKSLNESKAIQEKASSLDNNVHAVGNSTRSADGQNRNSEENSLQPHHEPISSPEQALTLLKDRLSQDRFEAVIRYLENGIKRRHPFDIHIPSATAAQILHVLVTTVIPDRWAILSSTAASSVDKAVRKSLLSCVSSVAGIGALTTCVQHLSTSSQIKQPGSPQRAIFGETVSFFGSVIHHKVFLRDLLHQNQSSGNKPGQQQALWSEATSLFAGSKILNVFQEASTVSELKSEIPSWLLDPRDYSEWLGTNIAIAAINLAPTHEEAWKMLSSFLKRTLSLGHKGGLTRGLIFY